MIYSIFLDLKWKSETQNHCYIHDSQFSIERILYMHIEILDGIHGSYELEQFPIHCLSLYHHLGCQGLLGQNQM